MLARIRFDWLLAACVVVATVAAVVWNVSTSVKTHRFEVEARLDALAKVVESRVGDTVASLDLLLRDASAEMPADGIVGDPAYQRFLVARSRFEPEALSVSVVSPDGVVLHSVLSDIVGKNVGERSYLTYFRTHPQSQTLFIGEPVIGLKNRTFVPVARAVRHADGTLRAIMVATVQPSLFANMVEAALPAEPSGTISLTNSDNVILAIAPPQPNAIGTSLTNTPLRQAHLRSGKAHSIQEGAGGLISNHRIIAFRAIQPWGLVVGVSATHDDLMRHMMPLYLGSASFVALVVVMAGVFLRLRTIRQQNQQAAEKMMLRAREHYLRVLDDMPALVRRTDGDGKCVTVNSAWTALTGQPLDQALGDGWLQAVHPDDRDTVRNGQEYEYRLLRADGGTAWIKEISRPLKDQDGNAIGILSSGLDITQSRQFQDQLQQSNAELEQFAYVASHDMREPLRMISSYLGLIERRMGAALTAEGREFLNFARDGAQRMDRLILDLLQYSRIGRMSAPKTMVDLNQAVEEATAQLELALAEQGASLEVGALPTVFASGDDMVRLFQNLIANAIKYRQDGVAPRVVISAQRLTGAWQISVADNGIGITPEFFERIFRIFQRLHGRDEHGGGTGIGLSICKKVVESHGGRIWVDSPGPNQGSVFSFTLPA